jgi:hypothetical protein
MSTTITGVVTNGVVVPNSPLPEGMRVEIHLLTGDVPNPLLNFHGHRDPNDPSEIEFIEEMARLKREDLERTLREDEEWSNSRPFA